jgi:DNA repair exonuclease SbcCD ATPase subunit
VATDDEVAGVAAELYAAPLAGFTAERTARVKAARDHGDRDLAARIGALQKPSASAWLIDLLAREHGDDLDRVDDLGERLRAAQETPDRDALRELAAERRRLLGEVAGIAADAAEAVTGKRPSAAVLEEVQQTLQAALASEEAAAAVRSGRLVRALAAEGLDPVDLTNAVAVGGQVAPVRRRPSRSRAAEAKEDDETDRRRKEAEQRKAAADRAVEEAEQAAADAADDADDADREAEERADAAEDLRRRLADLQKEADRADAAAERARKAAARAREAADRAEDEADDARTAAKEAAAALRAS